ncbi:MAG: alpha/beta hydrolase [Sulfitobacter sp.]
MSIWKETGRLRVGQTGLDYKCIGPGPDQAPTIVMLHEGLGCIALWRDFPEKLAAATGCGVLVYSRAGYGQSDPAELPRSTDYMTREAQDVLPQVLDAFDVRNAVLLGHSDGATIAAIYAGSVWDARVRGLVLMAPHFFSEKIGLEEIARAKTAFQTGNLAARMAKYHRAPEATFYGWCNPWLDPEFIDWNVAEVIDYLRIPTLAIQGAQDAFGTLDQITELEQRSYAPVDVVILDDCGHIPFVDQPVATLSSVVDFVARLQRIETVKVAVG